MAREMKETKKATAKTKKVEKKEVKKVEKTEAIEVAPEVKTKAAKVAKDEKVKEAPTSEVPTMNDRNSDQSVGAVGVPTESVGKAPEAPKKVKDESKEDTGSIDFQINNFSEKIKLLAKHLKTHIHDFDSRRGLLIMVGKRRRLLNYLKKSDPIKYEEMSKALKLKA